MRDLAIVGSDPGTRHIVPWNTDVEIWAFNEGAKQMPRVDIPFEMHSKYDRGDSYDSWLHSKPFMGMDNYPFRDIFGLTANVHRGSQPFEYFTSSPPYALALAALQNRPKIQLYGIEYELGEERKHQRECYAFWLGFCAGRGMQIDLHCSENMFKRPLYGFIPEDL